MDELIGTCMVLDHTEKGDVLIASGLTDMEEARQVAEERAEVFDGTPLIAAVVATGAQKRFQWSDEPDINVEVVFAEVNTNPDIHHPRAGKAWTSEETHRLREEFRREGPAGIRSIALRHGRTVGAIWSQLRKII